MQKAQRQLLRLAWAIHRANAESPWRAKLSLPEDLWNDCRKQLRRLAQVEQKGWTAAAVRVRRRLNRAAGDLQDHVGAFRDALHAPPPLQFASAWEIYQDLLEIDEEFDDFSWGGKDKTLRVSTEPITFDDVPLGRFWIELHWVSLRPLRLGCYRVIAREPNPAGTDDSVTHPHVQEEFLCEGDAQESIRRALSQGRLLDFFVLVRSVLETYSSAGPYVPIEEWGGTRCGDCDAYVLPQEVSSCTACSTPHCDECRYYCGSCDNDFCSGCIRRCAVCGDSCCSECVSRCARCGEPTCETCLQSNDTCKDCHENEQDESNEPDATVQSHGVGQAPVPA